MTVRHGMLLVLVVLGACESAPPPDLILTSTLLVDVERDRVVGPVDIAIREGRIQSIDDPGGGPLPDSTTQIVPANGTFAIPGLHDMHSHLWSRDMLAETYLVHGITSVRDMGGAQLGWQTWEAESDSVPVPRALDGGTIVDGIQSGSFFFAQARTEDEARALVDELAEGGVDFLKVYSRLTNDAFLTAAARARELGLPVAGHVPYGIPASRAVAEGVRSIEHFTGIALECSDDEAELRRRIVEWIAPLQTDSVGMDVLSEATMAAYRLERFIALDGYDPTNCPELMEQVERGEVWITPTLVVSSGQPDEQLARVEPHLSEWPDWMHGMMRPASEEPGTATPERLSTLRRLFRDLDERGARWLAGADAPNPGSVPGIGLHHELELLVDFGLTPAEALRAATLDAAEFAGRRDASGSLEEGKDADIVLLRANPLDDIRNTRDVQSVFLAGRRVSSEP